MTNTATRALTRGPDGARPAPLRFPTLAAHAPVIRRAADEVQVGLDPGTAVVLTGAGFAELLALLDGTTGTATVLAAAPAVGVSSRTVRSTLDLLVAAGLVVDARPSTPPPAPDWTVRLIGAGLIGRDLASLLADSGVRRLLVYDDNVPERTLYPHAGVLPTRSAALASRLGDAAPGVVQALAHWTDPYGRVDLTVVVADGPEVDRAITEHLVRNDETHLVVRTLGTSATVGPLVVPGRTSCLHCHDLARRQHDPQWPAVLDQTFRLALPTTPVVVAWAAATAGAQVLAFLAGEPSELESCTLELGAPDFATRLRAWPAHPGCGCSWHGPTEWGA